MAAAHRDTRGIVDPAELLARVRFRRPGPAAPLNPYVEHYWLIDWDLTEPYVSHVVPHPAVHIVFQRLAGEDAFVEVAGIPHGLFAQKLEGRGQVCGIKFRPGAFRTVAVAPDRPVSEWTGLRVRQPEVFPNIDPATVLDAPGDDSARVAALDAFLLTLGPRPDPQAELATALVDRIRADRTIRRVTDFARTEGLSVRLLQRLFAAYVGVGPKWVILRYRIHEALERAGTEEPVDWAALAADLGYADQAHLVRDFTATVGVTPTAYAQGVH
ncbi:helix-turn-helix transcriptional regulator [Streptomyces sp. NPDC005492]|uniref:helix-turn-helix transcriptional regulator n=1 Tax=Streptomyces sp. NPDC005492 TaxID=3156883 RepID=UPI0033B37039